jgi:hypothetical protein
MTIVFSVENLHTKQCGSPPAWTMASRQASELRAYFENVHGEQWIASATPGRFLLSGGDTGWETVQIDDPDYRELVAQCADVSAAFAGTIFSREERLWLLAVLTAAMGRMPRR